MGPNGSENVETLLLLQIPVNVVKLVLNYPPNGLHKNYLGDFLKFEFLIFRK